MNPESRFQAFVDSQERVPLESLFAFFDDLEAVDPESMLLVIGKAACSTRDILARSSSVKWAGPASASEVATTSIPS